MVNDPDSQHDQQEPTDEQPAAIFDDASLWGAVVFGDLDKAEEEK